MGHKAGHDGQRVIGDTERRIPGVSPTDLRENGTAAPYGRTQSGFPLSPE